MGIKKCTALDKGFLLLGNIILIGISREIISQAVLSICFLIVFFLIKVSSKKKIFFLIPGVTFLLPTLIISGIHLDENKIFFQPDYLTALRSISTLAAAGIFAVNTSLKELCYLMKKLRIPDSFIEITIYMFKFINLMLRGGRETKFALENRGGFRSFRNSRRDTALFFYILFQKIYHDLNSYNSALECRGYRGEFPLLQNFSDEGLNFKKIVLLLLYVGGITLILRGVPCLS